MLSIITNILHSFHPANDSYILSKQLGSYSACVYKVAYKTGVIAFLKIYRDSIKLRRELFALEVLKGEDFVPKVLGFSEEFRPAILLSYLPGEPFEEDNDEHIFKSGRALAKIHAYKVASFDPIMSDLNDIVWSQSLSKNFEKNMQVCRQENLFDLDKTEKWFHHKIKDLDEVTKPVLTHFDYRPGNLVKMKGGNVGVLDFESARGGAPHIDFTKIFLASSQKNDHLFGQFVKGYNSFSQVPTDLFESLSLYIIYMSVACVSWSIKDNSFASDFCNSNMRLINHYLKTG